MKEVKKHFSSVGFALLLFCGLYLLCGFGLTVLFAALELDADWLAWIANFVPLYFVAMPCCVLLLRRLPKQVPDSGRLGGKNFFIFVLMGFALMYFGNLVGTGLAQLITRGAGQNPLETMVQDTNLLQILVIVVIGPLAEEYLFRKQLIDHTVRYGEWCAVLLSAVAFALFHMNLYQLVYAFALGLLWGYVYVRTGRLRYSAILHMIVNFFGGVVAPAVLSLLDLDALEQVSAGTLEATEQMVEMLPGLLLFLGYVILILGLAVSGFVLLLVYLTKKRFFFRQGEVSWTLGQQFKSIYCNPGMILFVLLCLVMTAVVLFQ